MLLFKYEQIKHFLQILFYSLKVIQEISEKIRQKLAKNIYDIYR